MISKVTASARQQSPEVSYGRADGDKQPHLAIIVTSGLITTFFRGQIARLREAGFRVTFICSRWPEAAPLAAEGAEVITVPMEREIAPLSDVGTLWALWRILRRLKPDITNVGTPKGGLLGGVAALLARVPVRIYTIHGLRLETATGLKRLVLELSERMACASAHHIRCVGPSLLKRVIEFRLTDQRKAYVVGLGAANGVNRSRFQRTPERDTAARGLRHKLGIPHDAPVIGFVGRVVQDKGIRELCGAYARLKEYFPDLQLLLVGGFEDGDPIDPKTRKRLEDDADVHCVGMVPDAAPYYFVMDILALPSYREGLPNVPLEAAAAGIPTVATTATGAVDSVIDGITGRLVPPRDEGALAAALKELLEDDEKRRRMGQAGSDWVRTNFCQEVVWDALIADYVKVFQTGK